MGASPPQIVLEMMANAAASVMAIYLLTMRLPKERYMGTAAWYFLIVNLIKVPLSLSLGLITAETLKVNAMMVPAISEFDFAMGRAKADGTE